jgi:hypothetical protein
MQQIRHVSASEARRPAPAPMVLDVGRFEAVSAARSLSLVLGVLTISTIGGAIAYGASPPLHTDWSGLSQLVFWFGVQVAFLGELVGLIALHIIIVEWRSYQRRLEEWHDATLQSYIDQGGVEETSSYTAWELSATRLNDVLLLALLTHRSQGSKKMHTVTALEGDHWLTDGSGSMLKVGRVGAAEAERVGQKFADLGLVRGRGSRKAGEWVPGSADEVIDLVAKHWSNQ